MSGPGSRPWSRVSVTGRRSLFTEAGASDAIRPGERRSTLIFPDPSPAAAPNDDLGAAAGSGRARQPPNDVDLPSLLVDLLTAKDAVAHDSTPGRNHRPSPSRARLLACMEAYSAALTARQLPIPPRLRDDLRLHRALYSTDSDETA
jgi:hypothetical protein